VPRPAPAPRGHDKHRHNAVFHTMHNAVSHTVHTWRARIEQVCQEPAAQCSLYFPFHGLARSSHQTARPARARAVTMARMVASGRAGGGG
jgi:hypothetical protein